MVNMFQSGEWLDAVKDLRAKAQDFNTIRERVEKSGAIVEKNPRLAAKRKALLDQFATVRGTVEKTTQGIDAAYSQVRNVAGKQGLQGLGDLGLFWIPIAAIIAATGGVTYAVKRGADYLEDVDKETEVIRLVEDEDLTPQQAREIVDPPTGITRALISYGPWLFALGAVALVMFAPKRKR